MTENQVLVLVAFVLLIIITIISLGQRTRPRQRSTAPLCSACEQKMAKHGQGWRCLSCGATADAWP